MESLPSNHCSHACTVTWVLLEPARRPRCFASPSLPPSPPLQSQRQVCRKDSPCLSTPALCTLGPVPGERKMFSPKGAAPIQIPTLLIKKDPHLLFFSLISTLMRFSHLLEGTPETTASSRPKDTHTQKKNLFLNGSHQLTAYMKGSQHMKKQDWL